MVITLVITLYSTRLALSALGSSDYGIFYLVAGVISMLSFLNTAMAISTQRYLSFFMGKNEKKKLKDIFDNSVTLHLAIGLTIAFILEILGYFLFKGVLNIPENRIYAGKWIFHFMVISSFFTIISVPYDAIINAYENMLMVAVLSIFDAVGKLLIVLYISIYSNDRLILYGGLLAIETIILILIKRKYCNSKYEECKGGLKMRYEKKMLIEMFSFAGWNLYGTMCGVFRSQGVTIVLNYFFGTVVNAAYGIANQVNGQLSYFSSSILLAFNPQIMKSEGSGERDRMLSLSSLTSKYSFFLLSFFSIPLIIEVDFVLKLWLKEVPQYTVVFCQLVLVLTLINQLTVGLQSSAQAVGKIKLYQFVIGTINLMAPIAGFFALKYGKWDAYVIIIITIIVEIIAGIWRIIFLNKLAGLSISRYVKSVIVPTLLIFTIVFLITFLIHKNLFLNPFVKLIVITLISSSLLAILIYIFGISHKEREMFLSLLKRKRTINEKY